MIIINFIVYCLSHAQYIYIIIILAWLLWTCSTKIVFAFEDQHLHHLKQHNQAKIIQKSVLIKMALRCEHVNQLELRKSFKFWAAVAT